MRSKIQIKSYNIEIWNLESLSETRRAGEGQLREEGGQYTFFWKGYDPEQQRIHGVGFAIRNAILSKLTEQPIGICARLMTLRIQLAKNEDTTLISAYAPTLNAEDVDKEAFYSQLDNALSAIHKDDKIILLGNFNARKNQYKVSWQHPRSKHWHLIDYNIVRSRDQQDVLLTRALTGADECWTDHRLITSIMKIKLRPKVKHYGKADSNWWWREKACEIQQLAGANDTRGFFNAVKEIYGPSTHGDAPLKSKDSTTILKSDTEIGDRWKEHFEDLLNHKIAIDRKLNQLLTKIWINEDVPSDFRDANIIALYKRKRDRSECGNYRGISLLATAGKLLARILNNRLKTLSERILPETQAGFRPTRSTTDMNFSLRQLQEKYREQHQPLYMAFIDLSKAFDRVSRELLWDALITKLCDTTLFTIFIATTLHIIRDDLPPDIKISYRTDCKLLNLARLKSKTKTITKSLLQFQYADDNCVAALREDHLQQVLNAFHHSYTKLGLSINIKKTQILYQPSPSTFANADLSDEIQHRLKSAGTAFGKLRTRVFGDRHIQKNTNLMVYRAVVIPTLLYASETWSFYHHHLKTLEISTNAVFGRSLTSAGKTEGPT
ncbi:uncharacterized protein LOC143026866 [Oratosquilla oratoria]|uniref:uncharacterized protein LOC143026866 n=1 Tax=Oratosquilla oratoria TaxID=337810 RepID=UPI003F7777D7